MGRGFQDQGLADAWRTACTLIYIYFKNHVLGSLVRAHGMSNALVMEDCRFGDCKRLRVDLVAVFLRIKNGVAMSR